MKKLIAGAITMLGLVAALGSTPTVPCDDDICGGVVASPAPCEDAICGGLAVR